MKQGGMLAAAALAALALLVVPSSAFGAVDRTLTTCEPELDISFVNQVTFVFPQDREPVSGPFSISGVVTCPPANPVDDPWGGTAVNISGSGHFWAATCIDPEALALVGNITATPQNGEPAFSATLGVNVQLPTREKALGRMSVGGASAKTISMRLPGITQSCGTGARTGTIVAEEDYYLDEAPENDGVFDPADAADQGETPLPAAAPESASLDPGESLSDLPDWVFASQVYADIIQEGVPLSKVTFYERNVASVESASFSGCPRRYMCLYQHSKFRGRRLQFFDPGTYYMSDFAFNDRASSWRNRRGQYARLYQHIEYPSAFVCAPRYSYSSHMGYLNDRTSRLYLATGATNCR